MPLRVIKSSELLLNWNKQVQRSLNLSYQDNLENHVQQVEDLWAIISPCLCDLFPRLKASSNWCPYALLET